MPADFRSHLPMSEDALPPAAVLEHSEFVRRLASHLLRDDADADDAAQETLIRALECPPRAGPGVRSWLAAVLRNVVRMGARSGRRRRVRERTAARVEAVPGPGHAAARRETLRAVGAAVRGLTPEHRQVVLLRHYDGLPPRAIAERLGLPIATVKGRMRRAHEQLRARLDERRGGNVEGWRLALGGLVGTDAISDASATAGTAVTVGGGTAVGMASKVGVAVTVAAVVGGGLGFGAGYVVGTPAAERSTSQAVTPSRDADPTPRLAAVDRPRTTGLPPDAGPTLAERIQRGAAADLHLLRVTPPETLRERATVDALLERLRASVAAGDQKLCMAVVHLLGLADDPRGDAALVALVADESLDLPHPMGARLAEALRGGSPGTVDPVLGAAARRRIERAPSEGETSWTAYAGWLDLVAAHGTPEDLDWIVSLGTGGAGVEAAADALAGAGRPEALQRLHRLAGDRSAPDAGPGPEVARDDEETLRALERLAKASPEEAAELVTARVLGGSPLAVGSMRAFAGSAPLDRLPRVTDWLGALSSERDRIEATYVVQALRQRGVDVASLSPHLEPPLRFVERIAAGEEITLTNRPLLNRAGYAIEYNRALWSERAAAALEAAHARLQREGITVGGPDYAEVAKLVRAGLSSRWK